MRRAKKIDRGQERNMLILMRVRSEQFVIVTVSKRFLLLWDTNMLFRFSAKIMIKVHLLSLVCGS
jgi:hypothetical protein